jgi:beta-xylosidase
MAFSPSAPLFRSYNLIDWELIAHSVPVLDFGANYSLPLNGSGQAYVEGIWASFLNYRPSEHMFYWGGCIARTNFTPIYRASDAEGPWEHYGTLDKCFYDAALLIDDDDDETMYIAYGNTNISVAQLAPDGLSAVRDEVVFPEREDVGYIEGSRMYKRNGTYYILVTHPPDGESALKSENGPFGPYEIAWIIDRPEPKIPDAGSAHQGGIVQTEDGVWYYMAFEDAYPGGRVPVLAEIRWDEEGWPKMVENNTFPATDRVPVVSTEAAGREVKGLTGVDEFGELQALPQEYEWNHNPDTASYSLGPGGLVLRAATVTDDLYRARNTLTRRIVGPASAATVRIDYSHMYPGDRAGVALFRDRTTYVAIERATTENGGCWSLMMVLNTTLEQDTWDTATLGEEVDERIALGGQSGTSPGWIDLRLEADIRPEVNGTGRFSWRESEDEDWQTIGEPWELWREWPFFIGYRFAVFNFATEGLGGFVTVRSFGLEMVEPFE